MKVSNAYGLVIAVILAACGGSAKKEGPKVEEGGWIVTVKGKVGFPKEGGVISIREMRPDNVQPFQDTLTLSKDYTYEGKVSMTEPGYYQINFYNVQVVNFILDKSDVEINVDGNDPSGFSEVKGSPDQDLMMEVQKKIEDAGNSPEAQALVNDFNKAVESRDDAKVEVIREKYQVIAKKGRDEAAAIIKNAPPSLAVIYLLESGNSLDKDEYFDVFLNTAEKLKTAWPNSVHAKNFINTVESLKRTAVGQPAPEISLPDPSGKTISLSSFKGRYVLVDFWAKWCGPCRKENPNVVKAYKQFKGKNFDILGVSLDRTKEDWVQAIQQDGLTWHHVSDLRYFDSQAARDYNINGIPFSVLVDPNGIIIAKNLRGSDLQKKLAEVLN